MKFRPILLILITVMLVLAVFNIPTAKAYSVKENIIDDVVFDNESSMTEGQIQSFISQFPNSCLLSQNYPSGLGSAIFKTPIDYWNYSTSDSSPAHIIYWAANYYHLNPQVILATLEKEETLVSGSNGCALYQYNSAMGYDCPDNLTIHDYADLGIYHTCVQRASNAGFARQVSHATWQLRFDKERAYGNTEWGGDGGVTYFGRMTQGYRAKISGGALTYYDGYTTIDGETVYVSNGATAALYNYTPHFSNFYKIFCNWFGSTYAVAYSSSYVSQSAYPSLNPGASATLYLEIRNNGSKTWYDDTAAAANNSKPTRLATTAPINRASDFVDSTWLSNNRPSGTFAVVYNTSGTAYSNNPHAVKPGESVRFEFIIKIPNNYAAGKYRETLVAIEEGGVGVIPISITPYLDITVNKVISASNTIQSESPSLKPGETKDAYIIYKNTGSVSWYDDVTAISNNSHPIHLATMNPTNRASVFADNKWGNYNDRPSVVFETVYKTNGEAYATNPHIVKPGETAKFKFSLTAPDNNAPGTYREYFSLVEEAGIGVINTPGTAYIDVTTTNSPSAKPLINTYTENVAQTNTITKIYSFKNSGTTTWSSTNTQLIVTSGDISGIKSESWTSDLIASTLNESSVAPGEVGTFSVTYKATGLIKNWEFKLAAAINGSSISLNNISVNIAIQTPNYSATFVDQSAYPTMLQNSTQDYIFRFRNTGNVNWYDTTSASAAGAKPVVLASTGPINRISAFNAAFTTENRPSLVFNKVLNSDNSTLSSNQHKAMPGEIIEFKITLTSPADLAPGTYQEYFQPIVEGSNNWDMKQLVWTRIIVLRSSNISTYAGQSAYPTLNKGDSSSAYFMFKNTGNSVWYDIASVPKGLKPTTLAVTGPINRLSIFNNNFATSNRTNVQFSSVYESDGISLSSNQHIVLPGQIAKYSFALTVPLTASTGVYREFFQPIIEGADYWSMRQIVYLDVTVQ